MRVRDRLIMAYRWAYGVLHRAELNQLEADSDALEEDPECQAFLQELEESWPPPIPDFEPRRTAVFTSLHSRSAIRWYSLRFYRRKIRRDAFWLLGHGYHSFVVNYGSRYGLLALEELLQLREQGGSFRLYCGRVLGEQWRLSTRREGWKELCMACNCDFNFGLRTPVEYQAGVYQKASAFSLERRLLLSKEHLPWWLFENWERVR